MNSRLSQVGAALVLAAMTGPLFAADATNYVTSLSAQDMITNIATQLPQLMRFVTAFAYVMGMYLIFGAIMKLKQFGESRTMMSQSHELKGPLFMLVAGSLLLYLPTSVQVGLSTFWADPSPYGYLEDTDEWSGFMNNVYMVVQLVGVIAFVRGLVILSRLGERGGQGDSVGKAMTHIIGGIFCINIYEFIKVILFTLGIQVA
ncbi:MAG TPA: hypothetical protein VFU82_08615 [Gammaproteobacteria bacterium]|jgi:intracellular multiplication protein IcmC|nr:hypothetical protein [Gammaproteobacteria bacterium]